MWMFAVGVYLADLSPDDLRLVASYGFVMGTAGVLMGAIIGDAVDKYPRLKGKVVYSWHDMVGLLYRSHLIQMLAKLYT